MTDPTPHRPDPADAPAAVRTIDARWLPPPEPMELTLAALDELGEGDELILLLHREPRPLYEMLWRNGYRHRVERRDDGVFAIHIRKAAA